MKKVLKACFSVLLVMVSFFTFSACGKKASQVKIDLPETINYATATLQTVYGDIKVEIKRDKEIVMNLEIPVNTTAVLKYETQEINLDSGNHTVKF